jgi:hypothetical protein
MSERDTPVSQPAFARCWHGLAKRRLDFAMVDSSNTNAQASTKPGQLDIGRRLGLFATRMWRRSNTGGRGGLPAPLGLDCRDGDQPAGADAAGRSRLAGRDRLRLRACREVGRPVSARASRKDALRATRPEPRRTRCHETEAGEARDEFDETEPERGAEAAARNFTLLRCRGVMCLHARS